MPLTSEVRASLEPLLSLNRAELRRIVEDRESIPYQ
jgi:hypothetical protein